MVVLIPAAGRPKHLRETLRSISQSRIPETLTAIYVVENGPRCGADAVADEFAGALPVEYLYVPIGNKSLALNHAIESMKGDPLIVFFDDDVTVSPDSLIAYAEAAAKLPYHAYFGGPVKVEGQSQRLKSEQSWIPLSVSGLRYDGPLGYSEPDMFFLGSNWAAYRQLLISAGLFDGRFGPGATTGATGQEATMQAALRRVSVPGHYVPGAAVQHHPRQISFKWLMHRIYRNGLSSGLQSPLTGKEAADALVQVIVGCNKIAFFLASGQKNKATDSLLATLRTIGHLRGSSLTQSKSDRP